MATLKGEVKAFIVQSLACFDTPSQVVELVKKEFGLSITRQQVESHDPTKANGKGLAQKWVDMFNATRERFQNEISDIPIANKAYRLRVLDRIADDVSISIDGQASYSFDNTEFGSDGDPIPVFTAGYGVNWRHAFGLLP